VHFQLASISHETSTLLPQVVHKRKHLDKLRIFLAFVSPRR